MSETYADEWTHLAALLADNSDVVTAEDEADDRLPDVDAEEVDPMDVLNA